MAEPVLECVPNVSEGRDRGVLKRLAEAVESGGARLLDVHADADHHRAVFTFLGAPAAVEAAALAFARRAVELIDLTKHVGVHPRVGSLDVMPFVPLRDLTMDDAVAAAHRVGGALATAARVPVYFYGAAATRPGRRELPDVREGGLEGLGERLRSDAAWLPDAGPAALHPTAGAAIIGARGVLVAFNAVLATPDVRVARAIARTIRERSGGLPRVRALGLTLESRGLAQVSMNLLDRRRTSPAEVAAAIEAEAARRGTTVVDYELVGCAPADAFPPTLRARMPALAPTQLLDPALFGDA